MRKLRKRKTELESRNLGDEAVVTDLLIDAALFHAEAEMRWLSHVEQKVTRRWSRKSGKKART
jgi:hypothetical protein